MAMNIQGDNNDLEDYSSINPTKKMSPPCQSNKNDFIFNNLNGKSKVKTQLNDHELDKSNTCNMQKSVVKSSS